jgi:hypothetical protein
MADATLYEILGISKERAEEIASKVRDLLSSSKGPREWMESLVVQFEVGPECSEIFACGWFAGRYAGVSEVLNVVHKEMDKAEKERTEDENKYPPADGYA